MKKYSKVVFPAMLALLFVAGIFAFAGKKNYATEPATFLVGNASIMVAAPRGVSARNWSNGQDCRNGTMCRSTNHTKWIYWNATSLTNVVASTNMPDHIINDAVYNGGTTVWRRIPPVERIGLTVQNASTNEIWLSIGYPAVINQGIYLAAHGSFWVDGDTMQAGVFAVSDTDGTYSNRLVTQEW